MMSTLRRAFAVTLLAAALALGAARSLDAQGLEPLDATVPVSFFVAPALSGVGAEDGDRELANWAFETWQRALGTAVRWVRTADEQSATVRLYWAPPAGGQYGEMVPLRVGARRGAAVFVRPDMAALGPEIAALAARDPLLRDTIVYLTCLHELGHALGLRHTAEFADIMYFFGYGGAIEEYFGRFRRQLADRGDIPGIEALSASDVGRVRALYATPRETD